MHRKVSRRMGHARNRISQTSYLGKQSRLSSPNMISMAVSSEKFFTRSSIWIFNRLRQVLLGTISNTRRSSRWKTDFATRIRKFVPGLHTSGYGST